MNNNGNFHGGTPAALMSYPFPMYDQPQQHPPLMEHPPMHPQAPFFAGPRLNAHSPRFYPPAAGVLPPKAEKRKQDNITCDACGIEVNSQQMMDAHIRGQKHIKKMKLKAAGNSGATPDGIDVDIKPSIPALPTSVAANDSNPVAAIANPPPPAASSNNKSVLQSLNELAKFNKITAKYDLIKETGPAHCKQFDVRLTVADEIYMGSGTSIKRAQQIAAEQALANTGLKRPEQVQRASNVSRATRGLRPAGMAG